MTCNFCGSEDNEIIFEYARFERINVLKCKNCGLVFLGIGKTKKELELFYKREYQARLCNGIPERVCKYIACI